MLGWRMAQASPAVRTLVLGEGKFLQEGAHEELVKDLDGKYYALWSAQAQYYYDFEGGTYGNKRIYRIQ
ncbi:MAG: hypothetical protein K2N87_17770 [Eubacterium sp.]|nr:hypothetical protein [Eubacterium sp.]